MGILVEPGRQQPRDAMGREASICFCLELAVELHFRKAQYQPSTAPMKFCQLLKHRGSCRCLYKKKMV